MDLITTNLPDDPRVEKARQIFDVRLRLLAKKMEPGIPAAPDPRAYHKATGILAGTITADHYRSLSGEALSDWREKQIISRVAKTVEQRLEGRDLKLETAWSVAYDNLLAAAGNLRERALELAAMPLESFYRTVLEHALQRRKERPEVTWDATGQYLLLIANTALDHIGVLTMPIAALARFLDIRRVKQTPEETYPLPQGDYRRMPNDKLYHIIRSILPNPVAFHSSPDVRLPIADAEVATVQLKPPGLDRSQYTPPDELAALETRMWKQRQTLSDLDADVLDALIQIYLTQAAAPRDLATVSIDDLLRLRDIKPKIGGGGRRGGYDSKQRGEIREALDRIASVWVDSRPSHDKGTPASGRLIVLFDPASERPVTSVTGLDYLLFRPGDALAPLFFNAKKPYALMSSKVLRYNYRTQRYEKRLIRYLTWQWRIRAGTASYSQPYRVDTLIGEIGLAPSTNDPKRCKTRFEAALRRLKGDGLVADWRYSDSQPENPSGRNWLSLWLTRTIVVEPPRQIKDHYLSIERKGKPLTDR